MSAAEAVQTAPEPRAPAAENVAQQKRAGILLNRMWVVEGTLIYLCIR